MNALNLIESKFYFTFDSQTIEITRSSRLTRLFLIDNNMLLKLSNFPKEDP